MRLPDFRSASILATLLFVACSAVAQTALNENFARDPKQSIDQA
jgi:hypothetical protein